MKSASCASGVLICFNANAAWKPEWDDKVAAGEVLQLKFGPESFTGAIDEIVLLSRALEQEEIQQLMNGWDEAFAVEPEGKLATTWARVKATR